MELIDDFGAVRAKHDAFVERHVVACVPCLSYLNAGLRFGGYAGRMGTAALHGRIAECEHVPVLQSWKVSRIVAFALSLLIVAGVFIGSVRFGNSGTENVVSAEKAGNAVVTGVGYHPDNSDLELVYAMAIEN